jgi:hypothetical protein
LQIKDYQSIEEKIANIKRLVNAKVVLPLALFSEEQDNLIKNTRVEDSQEFIFGTKELNSSVIASESQFNINRNNTAVEELQALQVNYWERYNEEFAIAQASYDEAEKIAYENATLEKRERILCPSGCPEEYYVYTNLELPTFSFNPPLQIDDKLLKEHLTEPSYYVVESLKLQNEKTFDKIISGIDSSTQKFSNILYNALPGNNNTVTVGSMTFQSRGAVSGPENPAYLDDTKIPYLALVLQTSNNPYKIELNISFQIGVSNIEVVSAQYSATFNDGSVIEGNSSNYIYISNNLNVRFYYENNGIEIPPSSTEFQFSARIVLSTGMTLIVDQLITLRNNARGVAKLVNTIAEPDKDEPEPFEPVKFGVRRLGIADYKKVVAEVCCYREAEVSHIENIMAKEFKSKTTTRERIEEITTTTESQYEKENLTDTVTTDRFEMQNEVAKILQSQRQAGAYGILRGTTGNTTFETGANYASSTAKEESNRQAIIQSREITQQASERIATRFREEVSQKITERYKEENSHIFDNRQGEHHVSGVYRFINAIYKNQIYNYGKRIMYEFMVPQPSQLLRYGLEVINTAVSDSEMPKQPKDPKELYLFNADSVSEFNYLSLASEYGAEVDAPPASNIYSGKTYSGKGGSGSYSTSYNDIAVPEGYQLDSIHVKHIHKQINNGNTSVSLLVADQIFKIDSTSLTETYKVGLVNNQTYNTYSKDSVPFSVVAWDIGAYATTLSMTFKQTAETFNSWKVDTYDKIMAAYNEKLSEYNEAMRQRKEEKERSIEANPLFYRDIELKILQKACMSYLISSADWGKAFFTGDNFSTYEITTSQEMDSYSAKAKFMEQAFEWNIMSYYLYPFYWGKREQWQELFQSESDDAGFRNFMQAGMARVILTVRPGFEDAVMHYMATNEIWNGGLVPVIGDPLYMSIADELMEQEYTVEETWETVVPTSLIGLQRGGVAIDVDGLPCGGGCEDGENLLKPNDSELKPETPALNP